MVVDKEMAMKMKRSQLLKLLWEHVNTFGAGNRTAFNEWYSMFSDAQLADKVVEARCTVPDIVWRPTPKQLAEVEKGLPRRVSAEHGRTFQVESGVKNWARSAVDELIWYPWVRDVVVIADKTVAIRLYNIKLRSKAVKTALALGLEVMRVYV